MKLVLLGAGYGTRLAKDLQAEPSGKYKHLIDVPKPLLPIGSYPLISHWAKAIQEIPAVDGCYVVTNNTNFDLFDKWKKTWPNFHLVNDGSNNNESRKGAVACMDLTVSHFEIKDDTIIVAGDTLFYEDFELLEYIRKFEDFKTTNPDANMLLYVTCTDKEVHKYGILETDDSGLVTGFLEKPQPHETTSRKECPCFYFLNKSSLPLLKEFLEEKKSEPLKARDATGNFIAYLYKRRPVYAVEISGRFDVGGLDSYLRCHQYFLEKASS